MQIQKNIRKHANLESLYNKKQSFTLKHIYHSFCVYNDMKDISPL